MEWIKMILILAFLAFLLVSLSGLTMCLSPKDQKVVCSLAFNKNYLFRPYKYYVDFRDENLDRLPNIQNKSDYKLGLAPGNVLVGLKEGNDGTACIIVDTNNDHDLENETMHNIQMDSSITVMVERKWANGKTEELPYVITCSEYKGRKIYYWKTHYRTEGKLKYENCEVLAAFIDINGDGLFDERDSRAGSNLCLDLDTDGQMRGRKEWMSSSGIIEFCNRFFLVDEIAIDGSRLTLTETYLTIPMVGGQAPEFSLLSTEGKIINSKDLKGEIVILDFWASWCKPCVSKFPKLQELWEKDFGKKIKVIAINVDESSRVGNAYKIVKEYNLSWPNIIEGKGMEGPIWKMFGAIENNRYRIPQYIVIDRKGTIKYAGQGGPELEDLRRVLSKLLKKAS